MARISRAVFMTYYRALPDELQALHMFFRAAKEYHEVHRSTTSVQERRWARSDLEGYAYVRTAPKPVLSRCDQILFADRAKRIARVREQRNPRPEPVLRLDLNAGGGDVIPFRTAGVVNDQKQASA